jgi:hypothetical protein
MLWYPPLLCREDLGGWDARHVAGAGSSVVSRSLFPLLGRLCRIEIECTVSEDMRRSENQRKSEGANVHTHTTLPVEKEATSAPLLLDLRSQRFTLGYKGAPCKAHPQGSQYILPYARLGYVLKPRRILYTKLSEQL